MRMSSRLPYFAITVAILVLVSNPLGQTKAFTSHHIAQRQQVRPLAKSVVGGHRLGHLTKGSQLHVFGRKDKEGGDGSNGGENPDIRRQRSIPFFGRMLGKSKLTGETTPPTDAPATGDDTTTSNDAVVTAVATEVKQPKARVVPSRPVEPDDPVEKAKFLKAQAQRARLEAERMDAELTLSKIEKLEKELLVAKTKQESVEDLQRELDVLQAKLRGEAPPPPLPKKVKTTQASITDSSSTTTSSTPSKGSEQIAGSNESSTVNTSAIKESVNAMGESSITFDLTEILSTEDFEENKQILEAAPGFFKKIAARLVELDYTTVDDINTTTLATRFTMLARRDYSFANMTQPVFTESQIQETIEKINSKEASFPETWEEDAGGDKRKLAEYILTMDSYIESRIGKTPEDVIETFSEIAEGDEWIQTVLDRLNQTAVDRTVESLYPKCTIKEDADEPTMAQVQSLVANVLPSVKFSTSSKPEKVLGGYVLRGSHKYETGDELLAAIDNEIARTSLGDKMTVLYAPDFTVFARSEEEGFEIDVFDPESIPPILYIAGPDLVRERKPVLLSLTTALGFATTWYLSIYPFLLNDGLSKRVEEQLAVADAGMNYDLQWLTDLSVPLFWAVLAIQAMHEVGHRLVAAAYDMEISVPTLVPSLLTGTTSTVTTFKEPPKNKEALFDFAIAGPMAGILASVAGLVIGSQLTLTSDPATLPALPLEILRQSTLGGGIIDSIMQGSLYIPEGAPMTGISISLHPLAVAGYIGLIVNALALLPVGTTDGGRIAQALFGRGGKLVVGNIFLFALLFIGLTGSDLFLFYFAFVIAFQTGNEVPARNEVDDVSFPRVIMATIAYATAFLALVPFQ